MFPMYVFYYRLHDTRMKTATDQEETLFCHPLEESTTERDTVIPRYSRVLRSQEMPRIARFGVHSKTGVTFQSVKYKRKTSLYLCLFVYNMYIEIYMYGF
jgi:hypothetical protein